MKIGYILGHYPSMYIKGLFCIYFRLKFILKAQKKSENKIFFKNEYEINYFNEHSLFDFDYTM